MMLDADALQAMRECCQDDAAFERLQRILHGSIGADIEDSDRLRAEAELRETQERFRVLVEKSLVGIYVFQAGKFVYVNPRLAELAGYSQEELIGKTVFDLVLPEDRAMVAENIQKRIRGDVDTIQYTLRGVRKDGSPVDLEVLGSKTEVDGEPAIIGTLLDITERKRAEQVLQRENRLFAAGPVVVFRWLAEDGFPVEYVSANVEQFGYQPEEFTQKGLLYANIIHPDDLDRVNAEVDACIAAGLSAVEQDYRIMRTDGEVRWVYDLCSMVRDEQGQITHYEGYVMDITERRRSQEELQHSEARNRAFLHAIPDLMFRIHRDGTYLDCKADQDSDFAIPPSTMIGKTVYDILPPEVAQQRMEYIQRSLQTGETQVFEYQLQHQTELRQYEARIVVSGEDEVLAIMRDITESKRAAAQLRVAAERDRLLGQIALRIRRSLDLEQILTTTVAEVRTFLNADRVFIGQIDANWQGHILAEAVAPGWESILAWAIDDVCLREIRALFEQAQAQAIDDTSQVNVSPLLAEYYAQCQIRASLGVPIILNDQLTGNQMVFRVLIVNQCSQPRHWSEFEIELLSQLATQVAIAIQQAELYQQVQLFNANLERQVEERTLQLQQNMQELQTLSQRQDEFLHAISHDLRTPVMGMTLVLKNLLKKPDDHITLPRSILERMVQGCDRQLQMVNSLLEAHSSDVRGMTLHYEQLHLEELVGAIVTDLEPLLLENQATLSNAIAPDIPPVNADPALLRRVFENLITNALKHNPPGLHIILQAITQVDSICCTVQDNGVGMSQHESESLFERYAQGSRARRSAGLGLGLYLCRQIITAHGGQIGVSSTPGAGATFWFTLPLGVMGKWVVGNG
jgi:PAS domain S-box-containing protein